MGSLLPLAQLIDTNVRSWGIGHILIAIVAIAACVALVYVALKQFGIAIPGWVVQVFWIVVVAFVVIMAIKIVLGF